MSLLTLLDYAGVGLFAATGALAASRKELDFIGFLFFAAATGIGGGIVGPNAGDLISEIALAIEMNTDAADLGLTIHPHPTLSETVMFSAEAYEGTLTDLYVPKKVARSAH